MIKKRNVRIPFDIAAEVRSQREFLGLTQAEAAKRCKVAQPTIHAIEHGLYAPRIVTLFAIAAGLGLDLHIGDKHGKVFSRRKKNNPHK